jgi:uncharacterized protein (DUF4415 family)
VLQHLKGDKIRVKAGPFTGQRGVLVRTKSNKWAVHLLNGSYVLVAEDQLTNYSLAARRAWQSMPDRKVGRPVGSKVSDRVSVIFRIDRDLWSNFLAAERSGLVEDRTTAINECLRNILASANQLKSRAS